MHDMLTYVNTAHILVAKAEVANTKTVTFTCDALLLRLLTVQPTLQL